MADGITSFQSITRKAHKNRVVILNPLSAKSIWVKVKLRVKIKFGLKVKFGVKVVVNVNVCVVASGFARSSMSVCVVAYGFARCLC